MTDDKPEDAAPQVAKSEMPPIIEVMARCVPIIGPALEQCEEQERAAGTTWDTYGMMLMSVLCSALTHLMLGNKELEDGNDEKGVQWLTERFFETMTTGVGIGRQEQTAVEAAAQMAAANTNEPPPPRDKMN